MYEIELWNSVSRTTIALTIIQYIHSYDHTFHTLRTIMRYIHCIQSHITYITYNHTSHTLHSIISYIHCIQSYITYIAYNLALYTNASHTICRKHSQPFILTTHSSNMKVTQQLNNNSQP